MASTAPKNIIFRGGLWGVPPLKKGFQGWLVPWQPLEIDFQGWSLYPPLENLNFSYGRQLRVARPPLQMPFYPPLKTFSAVVSA